MLPSFEKVLFFAASSLEDTEERNMLLDEACRDRPALRAKVDAMFSIQGAAEDYLDRVKCLQNEESGEDAVEVIDGRIGRYRLIERIGAGGCGVVYLAEQQEPVRRKVALKIIKLGMDTEKVIYRFEQERQALAMMDHPNIARVLDAGSTSFGRPYFVMELVDGDKITDFCDTHRFDTPQQLEIFIDVCKAVQHAHQKGVIHRDLKPSNILVRVQDGVVIPKVIDFGIAKAAVSKPGDDITLVTPDQVLGTPAYMSPEVAAGGLKVDTRTDIHGLGCVLYELLTGRPAFDPCRLQELPMEEIRRILRDEDPQLPSGHVASLPTTELGKLASLRNTDGGGLIQMLKGDLDWIVMKALDRDQERRYETANGFALDLQRYLRHEPVTARPPDRIYVLAKWIRRNRIPFLFGGTVVMLLAGGFGTSTWLFLREKEARSEQEKLKIQANLARENESKLRATAEYRELVARAAVEIGYGKIEDADRLLAQVPVELAPSSLEAARAYTAVGQWHVQAGRWMEATDRFASAALALTTVDSSDSDAISINFIPAAATLCQAGDRERYDKIRMIAIERFTNTSHPLIAEQIVKSALLMPADPGTRAALEPLATFLVKSMDERHVGLTSDPNRIAWSSFAIALLKYREGEFGVASNWAAKCLAFEGSIPSRDASTRCLMAMIQWKLGEKDEARKYLEAARTPIEITFSKNLAIGDVRSFWFDWVNARVIYQEALSLIGS